MSPKRRSPLEAFLGPLHAADWRRAFILAEILSPPLARRVGPPRRIHGLPDLRVDRDLRRPF